MLSDASSAAALGVESALSAAGKLAAAALALTRPALGAIGSLPAAPDPLASSSSSREDFGAPPRTQTACVTSHANSAGHSSSCKHPNHAFGIAARHAKQCSAASIGSIPRAAIRIERMR